jgi:hypothetical protein
VSFVLCLHGFVWLLPGSRLRTVAWATKNPPPLPAVGSRKVLCRVKLEDFPPNAGAANNDGGPYEYEPGRLGGNGNG